METSKWLQVQAENSPQINTLQSCLTLCDLKCDNYIKLIAAHVARDDLQTCKLKVFKGTNLVSEHGLPGVPADIKSLYIDEPEPKIPIIAVAIGESILFYRNMKPYFKYTLPAMEAEAEEKEIWRKLVIERAEGQKALIEKLRLLGRNQLTRISQKLLQLSSSKRHSFITEYADVPLQRFSNIVAMNCLQRVSSEICPPSSLVVATEDGEIFILDTLGFSILYQAKTCSYKTTPSLMSVHGQYESDFCIVITSRSGGVYLLRKSWLEGKEIFKVNSALVGLVFLPIDETIAVAGMDNQITYYSKKGKQLFTHLVKENPVCMIPVCLPHLGLTMVCVALSGGCVQLLIQKFVVDEFQMPETVNAMIFGRLGQEEFVLTLITESGNMFIRILKRSATFNVPPSGLSAGISKTNRDGTEICALDKQKKSSIFIEQSLREKVNAKATYGSFQTDLWRLRHTAARATVEAINSAESMISGDVVHAPIKVAAEVVGVGPTFRLFLTIQNLSSYKVATNLRLLLHADRKYYTVPKSVTNLPAVLPGSPLKVDFEVIAIISSTDHLPQASLTKENALVRVIIAKPYQAKPLIAAAIIMPESEGCTEG